MFKKVLLVYLTLSFLFLSVFTPTAKAQWYNQDFFTWYERVYDPDNPDEIFGERYTAAQVEWVIFSFFSWFINHVGVKDLNWCVINLAQGGITGGLIDFFSNLATDCPAAVDDICAIATWSAFGGFDTFGICNVLGNNNTPSNYASTIPVNNNSRSSSFFNYNLFPDRGISLLTYIKTAAAKFNIIPEAQAQGFGFSTAANTVVNIWRFVRNLTYFLLVIAMVVMAFMIMFRVKLSPQTVITVQSAIPKIIITLVLITFSFAIAGFLIDLMYVVLGLLATFFTSTISRDSWATMFETFTQRNTVGLFLIYWLLWIVAALWASLNFSGAIVGNLLAVILVAIIWVVLAIVLIIATFKIWWMLIKTFVSILLLIIFSPIFILGGLIGFGGFGAWLKAMISNLAVYPVVAILLVFAFFFLATPFGGGTIVPFQPDPAYVITDASAWDPPLTFGSSALELMMVFVSLSVIMLIPKVAEIIKSAVSGRPFGYGAAIGEAFAMPMAWGQAGMGAMRAGRLGAIQSQMEAPGGGFWGRVGGRLGTNAPGPRQEYLRALI
ncbi:MAG: hypothetical protein UT24_C0005G0001, partial [Candidatus Woesebacteria bacterium GW2011_GWB1_39_12]